MSSTDDIIAVLIPELKRFHVTRQHDDRSTVAVCHRKECPPDCYAETYRPGHRCCLGSHRRPRTRAHGGVRKVRSDRAIRRSKAASRVEHAAITNRKASQTDMEIEACHDKSARTQTEAVMAKEATVDFIDLTKFEEGDDMGAFLDQNLVTGWINKTERP
ncbi:hypothetical protein FNYG_08622 [Fusarium nygamai]|uniref:Uncharacterized protein n=1 Tax=Gibberella nygamai TaxID=42673 RepID=A0A2K0W6L1_GIBNY|nr:hypothetical protein FNYG_08622 [Fusarium nygamai]